MVSLQQTDGMFQAGSVGRKLTASKGGSVLRKLAWQGFLIGLVLINPSGRMGSMHLPAALSPESLVLPLTEQETAKVAPRAIFPEPETLWIPQDAVLQTPDGRMMGALEGEFPASCGGLEDGMGVWVAYRPQSSLPPPKPVDRMWEGPVTPVESALLADAADGRLDSHSLLRAALIAGGTLQEEQLRHYETKFQGWLVQLREQEISAQEPLQRAESIFRFMHERILTGGYDLRSSDLAGTLQTGRYNCVSASLLYHCLLEPFGIEAYGLEMPGHARTRVRMGDRILDVETTCSRWFEFVRSSKESVGHEGRELSPASQRGAKEPEKPSSDSPAADGETSPREHDFSSKRNSVRQISNLALVATIYYNRGVDFLSEGRYAEALAANAKALRLDPDHPTAWGNFLATMNNWAVFLGRSGRYAEAADLLKQGLVLAPSYEPFQANFMHVHTQWTAALRREGRFAEAWELLAQSASAAPSSYALAFRHVQLELAKDWIYVHLSRGQPSQAAAIWQEVRRRLGPTPDVLEAERSLFQKWAHWQEILSPQQIHETENAAVSTLRPEDVH